MVWTQRIHVLFHRCKGKINVDYDATVKAMARDAALQTPVSVGVPSVFTTFIDPQVVPILLPPRTLQRFSENREKAIGPTTSSPSRSKSMPAM
ncbi:MAG: hypothetical protein ACLSE8_15630 [Parasutterella sp.]